MDSLEITLEEYRSLRQESLAAVDRQERVLATGTTLAGVVLGLGATGTTLAGVVLGLGANADAGSTLSIVLLLVLAPLLALMVTIRWIGEVERMVRAGAYVSVIEQRLRGSLPRRSTARVGIVPAP